MRVALTGSPGSGKTTLAELARNSGWRIIDVKAWAHELGAVLGHDAEDAADVIDVDALSARVAPDDGSNVLYEGHLSHLLALDVVWLLRCDPRILRTRLQSRGYKSEKVRENLEAEAVDILLQEALDIAHESGGRVIQRDASHRTPAQLLAEFTAASRSGTAGDDLEMVDWMAQLPIEGA